MQNNSISIGTPLWMRTPLHEYYVVQKVSTNGMAYIAIDQHSGGYPFDTNFSGAERYATLERAVQSMKSNSGTSVVHCKIYGEVVQQCEIDHQLRLSAIAKLTPEEIRALGLG